MSEPATKQFNLSKEELEHFNHLDYARRYLHNSIEQFIAAIITERLGEKPTPDKSIDWKLEDGKLVLQINEHESFYKPTPSE
jgi:hypothetical protein